MCLKFNTNLYINKIIRASVAIIQQYKILSQIKSLRLKISAISKILRHCVYQQKSHSNN